MTPSPKPGAQNSGGAFSPGSGGQSPEPASLSRGAPPAEAPWGESVSLAFPARGGCAHREAPSSTFNASHLQVSLCGGCHLAFFLPRSLRLPLTRTHVVAFRAHPPRSSGGPLRLQVPDVSTSAKTPLPWAVAGLMRPRTRNGVFSGGPIHCHVLGPGNTSPEPPARSGTPTGGLIAFRKGGLVVPALQVGKLRHGEGQWFSEAKPGFEPHSP